jgi:hypothetical protein
LGILENAFDRNKKPEPVQRPAQMTEDDELEQTQESHQLTLIETTFLAFYLFNL